MPWWDRESASGEGTHRGCLFLFILRLNVRTRPRTYTYRFFTAEVSASAVSLASPKSIEVFAS